MAPPNVVWITLDSVRADHTSLAGYERDTTPRIAALGSEGFASANCIAHGNSTLPSSGAILSGLAPSRNTLGVDGEVLPETITTIPQRFREAGYRTACLSRNSFLSSATGLDRGFDRFQWLASETITDAGLGTLAKYLLNIRTHSAGLTRDTAKHATPFLMNEIADDWLEDLAGQQPFFYYLHYNEPHRPYYPPLSYIEEYADEIEMDGREAAEFALEVHRDLERIEADGCELTDREWEALLAMYDAEIAYTDEMVGRLVERVREIDDTVVVVTADHGELFGEYGLLSHNYVLIDAVTRVPIVVTGLEDLAVSDDGLVQHADVMTTLLELAGADASGTVGVDLRTERREFAVSQRGPPDLQEVTQYDEDWDTSRFPDATLTSLRTEAHRYEEAGDDWRALFDVADQETDVADGHPDVVESLSERLNDWLAAHGDPVERGQEGEFSEAVQRQLRDLGYVD